MSFIKEFREFAMRGNVMDIAAGVVIGGAFGKTVSSLVADVIMPLVGILTSGVNFTNRKFVLKHAAADGADVPAPEVAIHYGELIQVTFDFLIIATTIFLMIKAINRFRKKEDEKPAPAAPPEDIQLLREIRDLLKPPSSTEKK
ncbi:MAG: large-conductance mechanosensitive channel protein MscL [Tannerella sp.]|jgi:large conductance mechanosensitive channel|nr:large-conductance mechanosensitive channel protein MscL [Tannerella sp.]